MMHISWRLSLVLVCVAFGLAGPEGTRAQPGGETWRNYTVEYWSTSLAAQGNILWVGTSAGLQRWDLGTGGTTKYTPADGLVGTEIHDVALDGQGRVWVGHERGLSVLHGGTWTTYDKDNSGVPGDDVYDVEIAGDGTVWLISRPVASDIGLGVTSFDGGATWDLYNEANSDLPDDHTTSLGFDHQGHLWVGTRTGDVAEFDGAAWTVHPDPTFNHNAIDVVGPDASGHMWFTSYYNSVQPLIKHDDAGWHLYSAESGCSGLRQGDFDENGKLWLTTWTGLCRVDVTASPTWTRYHTGSSGILDDILEEITVHGSMVWVGYGFGPAVAPVTVSRYSVSGFDHFNRPRILPRGLGQGLAVDHDDQIWFGLMMPGGVGMYDGETWTPFDNTNSGLSPTCYTKIAVDVAGHVWFAGGGGCLGGLVEYDGVNWTQHSGAGGVPSAGVQALAVDQTNRFWAGTSQGLSVYDGVNWFTYTTDNSDLPENNVSDLAVDGDEGVWVNCTTRFVIEDGTWETFATPEVAIQNYFYPEILETFYNDWTCWVADDGRDLVWRTNSSQGVKTFNGVNWQTYSFATMDLDHEFTWIAWPMGLDGAGNLWVVASDGHPRYGGVSRFDGATWTGYRQADGLLEPPNFAMAADGDNHVWFANGSGLSEFYNPWLPVHTTVTPGSGGQLTSPDGSTLVLVPPGSVSQDTVVTLTPLLPSPTGELIGIDHFFDLTAEASGSGAAPATDFDPPYSLTVNYTHDELGLAMETTLAVYWWDGANWNLEPSSSVNPATNQVTATPNHMTVFAVLGETNRTYLPMVIRDG